MSNVVNIRRDPSSFIAGRVLESVGVAGRQAWGELRVRASEGYDYLAACEGSPPDMFKFLAVGAFVDEWLVAGAPAFEASFRFDLPLTGVVRQMTDHLHRRWPGLALRVLGLGSPHADEIGLAFHTVLQPSDRERAFRALLESLQRAGADRGISVLFVKDVTERQAAWADPILKAAGYGRLSTLPVAHLDLPFATEEAYLMSLSANTRSNLRRKLKKAAAAVQVEVCSSIADVGGRNLRAAAIDRVSCEGELRGLSGAVTKLFC